MPEAILEEVSLWMEVWTCAGGGLSVEAHLSREGP